MDTLLAVLQSLGIALGYLAVVVLCIGAIILSCLSFSGTWLVALAALMVMLISADAFPGIWTVVAYLVVSGIVEIADTMAGTWGVARRGGSGWGGVAAFAGGLFGLFVGAWIPIPIVGSLLGMVVVSFVMVYAVENYRLKHAEQAAHIARGAVFARIAIIFLKVSTTLGMITFLAIGMLALD